MTYENDLCHSIVQKASVDVKDSEIAAQAVASTQFEKNNNHKPPYSVVDYNDRILGK